MKQLISYKNCTIDKILKSDILTFDIETTSYWLDKKGKVVGYRKEITDDEYNDMTACALCYLWTFGVNDTFYYGRELYEFYKFITKINDMISEESHIVWVHNLSFEFVFMANYIEYDSVFARNAHHPMKANWKKIEFRCTYFLTRLSLEKWGEQCGVPKLVGNLDYRKVRTPFTKLTKKELDYAMHDCLIIYKGIQTYIKRYGAQSKIPLTQTGEVRKVVKDCYKKDNRYHRMCTNLVPKSVNEYKMLNKVFAGGDTHSNMIHVGKILQNLGSYDEISGYPGMMFRKRYPMTPWREIFPDSAVDYTNYAYIMLVEFYGVSAKTTNHYISTSRMICVKKGTYDNGRVISADFIAAYVTEIDFELIKRTYKIEKITVVEMFKSRKNYLDIGLIEIVLDFFRAKTELKGIDEEIYMFKKQQLNSLFGMAVTNPVNRVIEWEENNWTQKPLTNEDIENTLSDLQKNPYKNFLSFSWGIYVTAFNRDMLWNAILQMDEKDVVYYDTDSVKFLNPLKYKKMFEKINIDIIKENEKACKFHGLPKDAFIAYTPQGKKSVLGVWDNEGDKDTQICYDKFITMGAKKYAYENADGIHITVAGVPKKAGECLKSLEDFKEGFIFDRDVCGKNLLKYVNDNPQVQFEDGYIQKEKLGINLKAAGYTLGYEHDFKVLIELLNERGWDL